MPILQDSMIELAKTDTNPWLKSINEYPLEFGPLILAEYADAMKTFCIQKGFTNNTHTRYDIKLL